MADYEFVKTEVEGNILKVTMNRPEVYNAIHIHMHQEMDKVWNDFAADPDLWVAVLTGAGEKAFSAGNDLKATAQGITGEMPASGFAGLCNRLDREKPIIGAVNGFAMGGGMETAISCDVLIAADTATFALPEVKVGFFAGAGGVQKLSRQIGRKAAIEMMLSGRKVGAAEAKELGIINEVVPAADLQEAAMNKAREIAGNSPSSVKATMHILSQLDALERTLEGLHLSGPEMTALRKTYDFSEGVNAFVEKRKPEWKKPMSLETFRAETRAWLDENCPAEMRLPLENDEAEYTGGRKATFASDAQKVWFERMRDKGWTVPHWPTEYGGGGLDKAEAKVLREEMAAINARRPLTSFGIDMLGPALLKFGNESQKKEHLTKITQGEIRWAQGYSEPNAGSDLASLMTKCEDKGDHYLINGQKIWTSYGDLGDWIFVLVRTDFEAKKHEGISFVLVDMDQPGVEARPIKLISGKSPFCETFFTDARCEKHNLVGEINTGWTIAKYLLTHEREMIGNLVQAWGATRLTSEIAAMQLGLDDNGILNDPMLRKDIVDLEVDALALGSLVDRVADMAKAGEGVGAESSTLKYVGTEYNKRRYEVLMDCAGSDGLEWGADDDVASKWLRMKGNSIEGGTSEVQLNIIAKRVLGMPA